MTIKPPLPLFFFHSFVFFLSAFNSLALACIIFLQTTSMVFSSVPSYLDPANWHQQPNHITSAANTQPPLPLPQGGGGGGSIRPGSMADRARLANIPMPETALKCPRCESTNTKFCYFNNYNLSQPRHFCKTCRRYWTRGGALRNVPVGGGCRRNKRSAKNAGSASKSPVRPTCSGSSATLSSNSGASDALGLAGPQIPPLRFLSPLNHLSEFGNNQIGLNYGSLSAPIGGASDLNFQLGHVMASGSGGSGGLEQWRLNQAQQFPIFGGLDIAAAPSGLYPFESGAAAGVDQLRAKMSSSQSTQMASVKMEDNNQAGINLSRQFVGLQGNGNQFWSGNANWTDLSNFTSSSTTNPL